MKNVVKLVLLVGLVLLLPLKANAGVTLGEPVPDFTLAADDNKTYSLSDQVGSYVVLEWTNNECPFVVKHYGSNNMQKLQKEYTDKGVKWFSIISSAEGNQGFCTPAQAMDIKEKQKASPTAVLLDPQGDVGRLFGAKTTPHMFIIDPDGVLIYQGGIDDKPSFEADDIKDAVNYVSKALDESMSGKPVEFSNTAPYGCSVKYQ